MPAIFLHTVTKTYGDFVAIGDLSLEIPDGTIYGLLGPNGAGKTTTIRMILDIIAPDRGKITVLGGLLTDRTKERIGYLPEERGVYPKMKLRDLLLFFAAIKGVRRSDAIPKITYWLERVDLLDWIDKPVETLSKGMQQKIQFITTLLHDPDLLILDEPFGGLDPVNTSLLKDILMELKSEGKTLILSTHIMEQAERLCERICLINRGRKVLDGDIAEIKSRYGRNTIHIEFDGNGDHLFNRQDIIDRVDRYERYAEVRLREGVDPQLFLREAINHVSIRRFEIAEPSLHDIFIDIVK